MFSDLEHLYDDIQILEEEKLDSEGRLRAAVPALLSWFAANARILPWREEPTPYRVWLSEIMLQQTRVEAVKPYFERFLQALPDIRALAEADGERLNKLWEGLGYYSRVRNLARAAAVVCERYGGELPGDYEELLKLPGIGSYTAGAIASIAFGQKVPAVDGNVLRVITRVTADCADIADPATKKKLEILLKKIMPGDSPGAFNQALMEVGATVCIPRGEPNCEACPFSTLCLSKRLGLTGEIPVKKAAKARRIEQRTVILLWDGERVMVRKRPDKGLLAGLYEFPNSEGWLDDAQAVSFARECLAAANMTDRRIDGKNPYMDDVNGDVGKSWRIEDAGEAVHVFSHVEWRMHGYLIRLPEDVTNLAWMADIRELEDRYAIPSAFRAYTKRIMELLAEENVAKCTKSNEVN